MQPNCLGLHSRWHCKQSQKIIMVCTAPRNEPDADPIDTLLFAHGLRRMAGWVASCYLALALLLAPLLGLMHGVVHGAGEYRQAAQVQTTGAPGQAQGWLADLFAAHAGASDCRVFDQLSHSDVVPALLLLALPMVPSAYSFLFLEGEVLARWAALFEARGPPLAR